MEVSLKGLVEIIGLEGICLYPYLDSVGVWTIGAGHTASESPDPAKMPKNIAITMDYAIDLFKSDIKRYSDPVNVALKVPVTQEQFDALTSITYNIGVGGMRKSTFIKRINNRDSMSNIANAILMWDKPKEIMGRRKKEAKLYSTGVYSNNGKALVFPVNSSSKPVYSKGKEVNVFDLLTE